MALYYIVPSSSAREPEPLVYFIKADSAAADSLIKVGFTTNLTSRLESFKTPMPRLELLGSVAGSIHTEKALHRFFRIYRQAGEWFTPSPIITSVARFCKDTGRLPDSLVSYVDAYETRRAAEQAETAALSFASQTLNRFRYKDHGENTTALVEEEHRRRTSRQGKGVEHVKAMTGGKS